VSTIVGAHTKTWRAARVMALESGAAPRAPMWPPAPRAVAACSSRWGRLLPVTPPQAGPVSPPACDRRAASRAARPAARRGVGEASGSAGDSRGRGGAGGDATGKGVLYFLYSRQAGKDASFAGLSLDEYLGLSEEEEAALWDRLFKEAEQELTIREHDIPPDFVPARQKRR